MSRIVDVAGVHFQIPPRRESLEAKENVWEQWREAASRLDGTGVDLVVTCEGMESVLQTVETAESVENPGRLMQSYMDFARRNRCVVAGSIKLAEGGHVYNALVYIGQEGEYLGDYRKSFLTYREVEMGLTPGKGAVVVETPVGRLGGAICYDLNFYELWAEYRALNPDIMLFSSMYHGGLMEAAWAYQCRCFFVAACKDNTSDILDPLGRFLTNASFHTLISFARINLDRTMMHLDRNMEKFPAIRRKYGKGVRIDTAPDLGVALLYCERTDLSAADIVQEFELIPLDVLFEQSRTQNRECRG